MEEYDESQCGLLLDDNDDDDDDRDNLNDVIVPFAIVVEIMVSMAYKTDEYANMLGLYTKHSAGTDTVSSARYLAQSYT